MSRWPLALGSSMEHSAEPADGMGPDSPHVHCVFRGCTGCLFIFSRSTTHEEVWLKEYRLQPMPQAAAEGAHAPRTMNC